MRAILIMILMTSCTNREYAHMYMEGGTVDEYSEFFETSALSRAPAVEFARDAAILETYTRAGVGTMTLPFLHNGVAPQAFAYMPGRVQFVDLVLSSDSTWTGQWRGDANAIAVVFQAGDIMRVSPWSVAPPQGPPPDGLPVLQKREVLVRNGAYLSWPDALRQGIVRCGIYDRDVEVMEYSDPEKCIDMHVHPDIRWVIRDRGPVLTLGVEQDARALVTTHIKEAWLQ